MKYNTVEEMCADSEKAVYHFFPASRKDDILRDGLLCAKDSCSKSGEKKGIYVVWSDNTHVQAAIAEAQASVDKYGNPVGDMCRLTIPLKKYGVTAKDIAPDLNGGKECDINSFCCKIVKDIKNINPADIEDWKDGNSDTYGVDFYNLEGYNINHKPIDYDSLILWGVYTRRDWKQMEE